MSSTEHSKSIAPAPEAPVAEVPPPDVEQEESMDTTPAPTVTAKTDSEFKPLSSTPAPQPQKTETAKVFKPAQPASGQFIKPAVPKTIQMDRPSKQSIEQKEEAKLKAKFGGLQNPGGSKFLQKRLNKGVKYFDSGDYNVARQSGNKRIIAGKVGAVQPPIPNPTGEAIPTPDSIHHRKPSSEISKLAV